MTKCVIGIDSGGTKYRIKACAPDGTELGYYEGFTANHHYYSVHEAVARIEHNFLNVLKVFGGNMADIASVVVGSTGIDSPADKVSVENMYRSIPGISCPITVMNDCELAHYAVTGGCGVLVISGTGSIAYAKDGAGNSARSGGWSFSIMGDEGSGAWVSRMALRYVGRVLDGAVDSSVLSELVMDELKIETRDDLVALSIKMATPPWNTPEIAFLVDEAAENGDIWAADILRRAGEHVFDIAKDAVDAISLDKAEPNFKIGVWGSNILKSRFVYDAFCNCVRREYPGAVICLPTKNAVDAAVELALSGLSN